MTGRGVPRVVRPEQAHTRGVGFVRLASVVGWEVVWVGIVVWAVTDPGGQGMHPGLGSSRVCVVEPAEVDMEVEVEVEAECALSSRVTRSTASSPPGIVRKQSNWLRSSIPMFV